MKYKHIVFDIDGTLLNNEYAVKRSLQETLETMTGNKTALEDLNFALGITGEDALKQLGVSDIPSVLKLWLVNSNKYTYTVSIFDGISELLEELTQSGYELGLVTSKTTGEYKDGFSKWPIVKYFKTAICADDTTEHKPTAAPLLKYMEVTASRKEELLYIGDSIYDRECAGNAGVNFALAGWGSSLERNQFKESATECYLYSPSDLYQYL